MRTIETTATVQEDGTLIVRLPPDVEPGVHHVVVVIDSTTQSEKPAGPLPTGRYNVGLADPMFRFRRVELYDDDRH